MKKRKKIIPPVLPVNRQIEPEILKGDSDHDALQAAGDPVSGDQGRPVALNALQAAGDPVSGVHGRPVPLDALQAAEPVQKNKVQRSRFPQWA
jgi:hypothetical protein